MEPKFNINLAGKIVAILVVLILIFGLIFSIFFRNNVEAAESYRYTYNSSNFNSNTYPGFKEKIDALKKAHPNWTFTIMETGLDWEQAITAESAGHWGSPLNLIQGKSDAWICSVCGNKAYDNGSWYHASEMAIRYYMDARNWLNDNEYLFQFLQIDYMESSNDQIYNALANTFLHNKDYASQINEACRESNVNPYYIIARLIQEQGPGGGATWKMTDSDGTVYYNLFNIGASGNGYNEILANALATAKARGWTSVKASIKGGVSVLTDYIKRKQNTQYLNKFDVEPYKGTYAYQYMQNIEAPKNEASKMYSAMKNANLLNQNLNFIIPVFTNMSGSGAETPDGVGEIYPKNIRVKEGHSDVILRSSASTNSSIVYTIKNSSEILLSVERFNNGWHKVVLIDGRWGYLKFNTEYLEEVPDVTNCSELKIINSDGVPMYVGPGNSQTQIKTLSYGQQVTRIDNSGRYTFGGTTWDRIVLADGRQGFVENKYLANEISGKVFTVSGDQVTLRSSPGISDTNKIRLLAKGVRVIRTGAYAENGEDKQVDGYYWDYVTTADGAKGYIARDYLIDSNGNVPGKFNDNSKKTEIKDGYIYAIPITTVEHLKNEVKNVTSIKNKNGETITSGNIGTGSKVVADGKEYTVIKLGDVNGDGEIDIIDLALMKREIVGSQKLDGIYKIAGNISERETLEIDIIDLALLKRQILGTQSIKI